MRRGTRSIRSRIAAFHEFLVLGILLLYIGLASSLFWWNMSHQLYRDAVQNVKTAEGLLSFDAAGRLMLNEDYHNHPSTRLVQFPSDKGLEKWHRPTDKLFLGIDHTAIVVWDTDASIKFYRHGARVGCDAARSTPATRRDRRTNQPASWIRDQFKQTMVGGEAVRMAEADWAFEEGETTRAGEGGLVVRVQLRGLQPDPYPETAGAERVKQRPRPSVAADDGRADPKQQSVRLLA
jgi:catechol 2,3-dioxygenase-like lactoylglutathione lyase family enzyme